MFTGNAAVVVTERFVRVWRFAVVALSGEFLPQLAFGKIARCSGAKRVADEAVAALPYSLTHTPSPMRFLQEILGRPKNEKPFVLIPVGLPVKDARVPDISRKPLEEIMTVL